MAPVEVWADDQAEENAQTHATDCQMCAVEKPKLPERKMGVVVRLMQRKIETRRSPCKNERSCKQETGAKPSRGVAIFSTERCQNEERRNDSAKCTGNNLVEVHGRLRLTKKFSSGAGCEDLMPRRAVMPAPSAATAGSACPWLVEHHRTTSHPRHQPRVGQPCRGQACADTPAALRRAGTRRQRLGGPRPRRSTVRSPPAAFGYAPR